MRHVAVAALLVSVLATPASAASTTISVENFRFTPSTVGIGAGRTVVWKNNSGTMHNVASSAGMFRSGSASSSFTFSRTFSAGTFAYLCEVHPGMTGRVRVKPRASAAPTGHPFTVRWATTATNTGSRFTVQYRVGDGSWRTWRAGTETTSGVFGAGSQPVTVAPGRTYGFRVKSHGSAGSSGYSPVRRFIP